MSSMDRHQSSIAGSFGRCRLWVRIACIGLLLLSMLASSTCGSVQGGNASRGTIKESLYESHHEEDVLHDMTSRDSALLGMLKPEFWRDRRKRKWDDLVQLVSHEVELLPPRGGGGSSMNETRPHNSFDAFFGRAVILLGAKVVLDGFSTFAFNHGALMEKVRRRLMLFPHPYPRAPSPLPLTSSVLLPPTFHSWRRMF